MSQLHKATTAVKYVLARTQCSPEERDLVLKMQNHEFDRDEPEFKQMTRAPLEATYRDYGGVERPHPVSIGSMLDHMPGTTFKDLCSPGVFPGVAGQFAPVTTTFDVPLDFAAGYGDLQWQFLTCQIIEVLATKVRKSAYDVLYKAAVPTSTCATVLEARQKAADAANSAALKWYVPYQLRLRTDLFDGWDRIQDDKSLEFLPAMFARPNLALYLDLRCIAIVIYPTVGMKLTLAENRDKYILHLKALVAVSFRTDWMPIAVPFVEETPVKS